MTRSIHTTRRQLEEHAQDDYLDLDHKRDEARRLRLALAKKRRIKDQVATERRVELPTGTVVDPATIPILVEDSGAYVHHGATPDDLVAVLRRLPSGVVDGVTAIRLGLGLAQQPRASDPDDDEADPLTSRRPSFEVLPGVHSGVVLGVYNADRADIYLCGYAHEASLPEARVKSLYLTLQTLATLVHEVAHHHDYSARVARGRWLADDTGKKEMYAERMEHAWVNEVVIPYLEETRAADVAHLREWLIRHGGADVPLAVLFDDPRLTRKGGIVGFRFGFRGPLASLLEAVAAGGDPIQARVDFARELHYADEYAIPRAILAGVLAERPAAPEAYTLLADIDVHEGHNAAAEARCRDVIAHTPSYFDAWQVLVNALRPQERWADVVDAATRGLGCAGDRSASSFLLRHRAHAYLELGDHAAVAADLGGLALGGRSDQRWAWTLRAMQALRQGDPEQALAIASRLLVDGHYAGRVELAAVRFEAAHRLGRPEAAGTLTPTDLERLRYLGHSAWVDRLDHLARA